MVRKLSVALIVAVGLAAIGSLFVNRPRYHRQNLKSCFDDAGGLHAGASVRIAGVDVGTVGTVRVNPQDKNCPAQVEMLLATTYEIKIPKDSIAGIETAGILGAPYVSIDTTQASGAPIENYGYLKSKPSANTMSLRDQLKAADVLLRLVDQAIKEREKEVPKDSSPPAHPSSR